VNDYEIVALEKIYGDNFYRETIEKLWMNKLRTFMNAKIGGFMNTFFIFSDLCHTVIFFFMISRTWGKPFEYMKSSIPYGLGVRIKQICSEESAYKIQKNDMKKNLCKRGYTKRSIDNEY
jgi:hypothetical protein